MKSINQETVMNEIIALAADECRTKNPTDMIETYITYMKDQIEFLRHCAKVYNDKSYTVRIANCETRVAIAGGILAEITETAEADQTTGQPTEAAPEARADVKPALKMVKKEWCENWIRAYFAKEPEWCKKIEARGLIRDAQRAGLTGPGVDRTAMSEALEELCKLDGITRAGYFVGYYYSLKERTATPA